MVSMMIEFTSNNHQIERICFNSFIITRQNDDGGREIISMVPFTFFKNYLQSVWFEMFPLHRSILLFFSDLRDT